MDQNKATCLGRILIADDEETFLEAVADYLSDAGYECDCVRNAPAAAEKLQEKEYDLLISDIKMPGNPKLELISQVQKIARGMPVILVTGYPTVESAANAVRLPVAAYLLKPLDFDELLSEVRMCVKRSKTYRTIRDTRRRLEDSCFQLDEMEATFVNPVDKASGESVDAFVALTLESIVGSLSDLRHVTESLAQAHQDDEQPQMVAWTRLDISRKALREAIDVLEATKRAFKSKQLGTLRHKLQVAVDQLEAGTVWETDVN